VSITFNPLGLLEHPVYSAVNIAADFYLAESAVQFLTFDAKQDLELGSKADLLYRLEKYQQRVTNDAVDRFFTYWCFACVGEFRHIQNLTGSKHFTKCLKALVSSGKGNRRATQTSSETLAIFKVFGEDVVLQAIEDYFDETDGEKHWGKGYGGEAWGTIAENARLFVTGKRNAKVFLDTSFSIQHNGGLALDKSPAMCVGTYDYNDCDAKDIMNKVLDSQATDNLEGLLNVVSRIASKELVELVDCIPDVHHFKFPVPIEQDFYNNGRYVESKTLADKIRSRTDATSKLVALWQGGVKPTKVVKPRRYTLDTSGLTSGTVVHFSVAKETDNLTVLKILDVSAPHDQSAAAPVGWGCASVGWPGSSTGDGADTELRQGDSVGIALEDGVQLAL